jgi:hypothetical protein
MTQKINQESIPHNHMMRKKKKKKKLAQKSFNYNHHNTKIPKSYLNHWKVLET